MVTKESGNIKLADIEKELDRLWEELDAKSSVRACLFNFILYAQDPERIEYYNHLLSHVIQKYPCRILFIQGCADQDQSYLRTFVSTTASEKNPNTAACDRISIEVTNDHLETVPFLITPHLIPDLPVYLLWGEDPSLNHTLLQELEDMATRIVFDSEASLDIQKFSWQVLQEISATERQIFDLNWALLRPWRDVMTQVFRTEDDIRELLHTRILRVYYNGAFDDGDPFSQLRALYLQAWLAAQLTWKYVGHSYSERNLRIVYHNGVHEVVILLVPQQGDDIAIGSLRRIDVESSNKYHFSFQRGNDGHSVSITSSTPHSCSLPYKLLLTNLGREQALIKEILYQEPGAHYRNMLQIITTMNGELCPPEPDTPPNLDLLESTNAET